MIHDCGDVEITEVDAHNIPVDIWILPVGENDGPIPAEAEGMGWALYADDYMPRKSCNATNAYRVYADSREELAALVRDHVLPLYRNAIAKLEAMVDGSGDSLYYWDAPKEKP